MILQEVGSGTHVHKLDETDPPASLVVPQPDGPDPVCVEDLGVGRDAREAVEYVVVGCVVRQPLDDDGGRGPGGRRRVAADRGRARCGRAVAVVIIALIVIVGKGGVVWGS